MAQQTDGCLDPVIKKIIISCISNIGGVRPCWMYVFSECSCILNLYFWKINDTLNCKYCRLINTTDQHPFLCKKSIFEKDKKMEEGVKTLIDTLVT